MPVIRARVQNGRLLLDEPTELPEGTVLNLVIDDEGDSLDASERAALNTAISKAWASIQAGQGGPANEPLAAASQATRRELIVSPQAAAQAEVLDAFSRTNLPASPDLFARELAEAFAKIARVPAVGHRYSHPEVKDVRRVPLCITRVHAYYVDRVDNIAILAVWSAVQAAGLAPGPASEGDLAYGSVHLL